MRAKFTLGISPCPNDTFIFYALLHGKIPLDFDLQLHFADVEQLNTLACQGKLDIVKVSIHAIIAIHDHYHLLRCGGAMGYSCGPILIKKLGHWASLENLAQQRILLPGKLTTASLYFRLAHPEAQNIAYRIFSDIMPELERDEADAGVIIHESRFTFSQRGLTALLDLGQWWEKQCNLPIPLGGIAIHKNLPQEVASQLELAIRQSIEYAQQHKSETLAFCRNYAQEMQDQIMQNHIDLYVNEFSLDFGPRGEKAIQQLFVLAQRKSLIKYLPERIFR